MKFNDLPEGFSATQLRRTDFESLEQKIQYDAANLLRLAEAKYGKTDVKVGKVTVQDALDLAIRKDDDLEALRKAIAVELKGKQVQFEVEGEEPRLRLYRAHYERWQPHWKKRHRWEGLKKRLLANDGHYLKLAAGLTDSGYLFGVDQAGNPLIAEAGEPNINAIAEFESIRDDVFYESDESGENILMDGKNGFKTTGYEVLDFDEESSDGENSERALYEEFNGKNNAQIDPDQFTWSRLLRVKLQ